VPLPCDKGTASNNGDPLVNSPGTDDAALHVLFNVIVVFLEQSSNLWFTPTEIATSLQEEGVSEHLHGFHVRLAINKRSRLGIIATHELQLSGGDRLTYFRLSSVSDAYTPRKQRESDSFCLPPKCNLKALVAQERLDLIESFCRDDTTSDDNHEGERVTKETEGQSTKMGDAADELLCQKCTVPTCGDCGTDERGLYACGTSQDSPIPTGHTGLGIERL
jgi:hypothetical protein